MISEQTNLDLITHMHKFNRNVKQVREINYFLKGYTTHKGINGPSVERKSDVLLQLGYQDSFKSISHFATVVSNLYKHLGFKEEKISKGKPLSKLQAKIKENKTEGDYSFLVGVIDEKIVTPIFLAFNKVLSSSQREEISKRLNVSVIDIANNLVRLVPK